MKIKLKNSISTLLTFIMFFTLAFNNVVALASDTPNDRTITAKINGCRNHLLNRWI